MYNTLYDENIKVPFSHSNDSEVPPVSSLKWCPTKLEKSDIQRVFQDKIRSELEKVAEYNPFENAPSLSSIAASQWPEGQNGYDTRPRFYDPLSGTHCLVDTGSAICAVAAGPDDVPDPALALMAANGTMIECCGYKTMEVQIGRKRYSFSPMARLCTHTLRFTIRLSGICSNIGPT